MSQNEQSERGKQRGYYFFVNAFLLTFIEGSERLFDKKIFIEKEKAGLHHQFAA